MLNRRNCFYDHVELSYRMGDEALDCRGHWKRIHLRASVGIDGHSLFCVESVTGFGTPFSILVCERFLGVPTNALAVPKLSGKIHPLFVPIRISGGAFEQGIDGKRFVKGAFSFRDKICPPHWITIAIRQLFPIGSHVQNVGQCLVGRALMRKGGRLDKINMRLTDPAPKGKSEGQMKKCKRRRPLSLAPAK